MWALFIHRFSSSTAHKISNISLLTGGASANVVSLTAVVDALESQRRELGARNKELELQVRDLLAALKKQANDSAAVSTGRRSNEEEAQARRSSEAHR